MLLGLLALEGLHWVMSVIPLIMHGGWVLFDSGRKRQTEHLENCAPLYIRGQRHRSGGQPRDRGRGTPDETDVQARAVRRPEIALRQSP